jgi:phytanoyl-CoA hydroxylase
MLAAGADQLDVVAAVAHLHEHGWARLGVALSAEGCATLRAASDDVMQGRVDPAPFFFQHDSTTGRYEDLAFGAGWVGPSPAYRKIERLEREPRFRAWIEHPLMGRIAHALMPGAVALYRAVLWNKAAGAGMDLPWHQDGGRFWGIDRQPELTIWTALDDAPVAAGCVEVIERTHGALATAEGGTIPDALTGPRLSEVRTLPAAAGEVLLLHNLVWHRSRRNTTTAPRRALSVCYMPAETRCTRTKRAPRQFVRLFDPLGVAQNATP